MKPLYKIIDVQVEEVDFSKQIQLSDDEEEEEDNDEEFEDIPDSMEYDAKKGTISYDDYVAFYQEEIEGKFHRRQAQIALEKGRKRAKLNKQDDPEQDEEAQQEADEEDKDDKDNQEGEGEGDGEGDED